MKKWLVVLMLVISFVSVADEYVNKIQQQVRRIDAHIDKIEIKNDSDVRLVMSYMELKINLLKIANHHIKILTGGIPSEIKVSNYLIQHCIDSTEELFISNGVGEVE